MFGGNVGSSKTSHKLLEYVRKPKFAILENKKHKNTQKTEHRNSNKSHFSTYRPPINMFSLEDIDPIFKTLKNVWGGSRGLFGTRLSQFVRLLRFWDFQK